MEVKRFQPLRHEDKIPQMGWNSLYDLKTPLFKDVNEKDFVYFVHSYYVPFDEKYTIAKADFTLPYSAAINKDNFYATQFHPEKSGSVGANTTKTLLRKLRSLRNWASSACIWLTWMVPRANMLSMIMC